MTEGESKLAKWTALVNHCLTGAIPCKAGDLGF